MCARRCCGDGSATARAVEAIEYLAIDSELLDMMITWDQTGTYEVADLPPDVAASGASGYVSKERFGAEVLRRLWENRDSGVFAAV